MSLMAASLRRPGSVGVTIDDPYDHDRSDPTLVLPPPPIRRTRSVRVRTARRRTRRWLRPGFWAVAMAGVVMGWFGLAALATAAVTLVVVARMVEPPDPVLPPLTRVFPADPTPMPRAPASASDRHGDRPAE